MKPFVQAQIADLFATATVATGTAESRAPMAVVASVKYLVGSDP